MQLSEIWPTWCEPVWNNEPGDYAELSFQEQFIGVNPKMMWLFLQLNPSLEKKKKELFASEIPWQLVRNATKTLYRDVNICFVEGGGGVGFTCHRVQKRPCREERGEI